METNPIRVCEVLVGLPEVDVLSVDDTADRVLRAHVPLRIPTLSCCGCNGVVRRKDSDHRARVSNGPPKRSTT